MHEFFHTIKLIGGELDMERHHHNKPEYLMYNSAVYFYKNNIPKVDKRDFIKINKFIPGSTITR